MKPVAVTGFKGLNNRLDPVALGLQWQLEAENVLCDSAGYLVRRPGFASFLTDVADANGTDDGRLFVVDTIGTLFEVASDGSTRTRATGFTGAPFQWAQLGYALFALSETTAWCIYPDRVVAWGVPVQDAPTVSTTSSGALEHGTYLAACILVAPDGRQGGCIGYTSIDIDAGKGIIIESPEVAGYATHAYLSTADGKIPYRVGALSAGSITVALQPPEGTALETLHVYPPPLNGLVSAHGNRLCVAVWDSEHDRTVLYWSRPDAPHQFDLETDYQIMAGQPMLLAQADGALLVGTDRSIIAILAGQPPQRLANYGASRDTAVRMDSGQIAFWTDRGVCTFPPFTNLTDAALIPENRTRSTGAVLHYAGGSYYVTAQRGEIRGRSPLAPHEPLIVTTQAGG